jgi:hypothetical protein
MTQARLWAVFLVDTSCLMRLDGLDRPPPDPPAYSPQERQRIWQGLTALAQDGRLKLIKQVKGELERWHPVALSRLKPIPGTRMPRVNNELRLRYQWLLAQYPRLIPADPAWLIVSAQQYGFTIVTEELPTGVRRSRPRHGPPMPDLCNELGIPWTSLRSLAGAEGWIR